jgi:hypothetical protein
MTKGRKRIPDERKVIRGTFRNDRANPDALPPDPELPRSPSWITPEAREYFGILKERLDSIGLASKTFTEIHALTAQRMADRDVLQQKVYESDFEDFRIAARYEKAVSDVKSLLAELGLTQVTVSKTHPLDNKRKSEGNRFAQFPNR